MPFDYHERKPVGIRPALKWSGSPANQTLSPTTFSEAQLKTVRGRVIKTPKTLREEARQTYNNEH